MSFYNAIIAILQAASGSSVVGYLQSGLSAIAQTVQSRLRQHILASDFGAAGVSTVVDSAAIQAACDEAHTRGGGIVEVNSFISQSINLSSLSLPSDVTVVDQRYTKNGWMGFHNESADMQLNIRGLATPFGEGPTFVAQNLASSGNRNVSFAHWYGPTTSVTVASFEHWGYNSDSNWYAGREYLTRGSIDSGFRARVRQGNDGGIVYNPNGNALSYRNNPAVGFTQDYFFVYQAPLQSGYTYSGKMLFSLRATQAEVPLELCLQTDTGESGAAVANATLRFQQGLGPAATNRFAFLCDFPSSGQLTLYDYIAGTNKIVFTSGGDTVHTGVFKPSADNVYSCGTAGNRWSVIYAGTGAINTSDVREKRDIRDLSEAERRVAKSLKSKIKAYRFISEYDVQGESAKIHFGVIAQEVSAVFIEEGLDPDSYSIVTRDEWTEHGETKERFGVRYSDLLSFIIASL